MFVSVDTFIRLSTPLGGPQGFLRAPELVPEVLSTLEPALSSFDMSLPAPEEYWPPITPADIG
jgi:hypothetical protein